jgi:phage terminase large subunit-like protein
METGDMLSDGTHKGSESQADQRTHVEDPQRQRGSMPMTWTQMETAAQDLRKWKTCSQVEEGQADQRHMVKFTEAEGEGRTDDLDPDGDRRHAIRWNPQGKWRPPGRPKNTW